MSNQKKLRYPAVPLITIDPYFSIWSMDDKLYDGTTKHWTERHCSMGGFVYIDGIWYRFMGSVKRDKYTCYKELKTIPQLSCEVFATRTEYEFANELIELKLIFRTLLLPDDLKLMSRPVSYISYELSYKDGNKHDTRIYFEIGSECCVQDINESILFDRNEYSVYCGKGDNDVLKETGDGVLIDWGYLHLIAPDSALNIYDAFDRKEMFCIGHDRAGITGERRISEGFPVLSSTRSCGEVQNASGFICLAYNDIRSIEYFGQKLKGYWTIDGDEFKDIAHKSVTEYENICKRCDRFDELIRKDGEAINGKYADIISLSYRQIIAAHKLVHKDGRPLLFSKECGSNGCLGTVDITYPSMPVFLKYAPGLVRAMLDPIFEYAENDHGWEFEFAPHDVGQYPKANGQVYGFEKQEPEYVLSHQMPIEECGNMLLATAVYCKATQDLGYAKKHYLMLKQWADYLVKAGWDPENQLCTDDFAGHLAHNCNLSVKGILAIAAFTYISEQFGENADEYFIKAKEYAREWENAAFDDDHYMLAFGENGSWSLKYNLLWDRYFGFGIFSDSVAKTEVDFYKTRINKYGIPLDSRKMYTKSDWQMWTACLRDDKEYLLKIIDAMWRFIDETTDRLPFTDWYETMEAEAAWCFRNRTVQGGLFAPLLFENA